MAEEFVRESINGWNLIKVSKGEQLDELVVQFHNVVLDGTLDSLDRLGPSKRRFLAIRDGDYLRQVLLKAHATWEIEDLEALNLAMGRVSLRMKPYFKAKDAAQEKFTAQ